MRNACFLLLLAITFKCSAQQIKTLPVLETPHYYENYIQNKPVPVIRGVVKNMPDSIKKASPVITVDLFPPDVDGVIHKQVKIAANGSFAISTDRAFPIQKISLGINEYFIQYFYVAKDLFITIDYHKFYKGQPGGVIYKSADTDLNKFMQAFTTARNAHNYKTHVFDLLEASSENDTTLQEFNDHQRKLNNHVDRLVTTFLSQHPANALYQKVLWNDLLAARYEKLLGFYNRFENPLSAQEWQKINAYKPLFSSIETHNFYFNLNKCAGLAFAISGRKTSYPLFLKTMFTVERVAFIMDYNLPAVAQVGIDAFNQRYKKEMPLAQTKLVKMAITDYYRRVNAVPDNIQILKTAVNSHEAGNADFTFNKTALSNNLSLYSNDKIDGITILKQLSKRYKDKVLLIDMWGTWCAACIDRFPQSAALHSKIDTSKVEFVYLCNTSPKKDCMIDIVKFNLAGTNVWLNKTQTAQLEKLFALSGYPTYVLIDKKGNMKPGAGYLLQNPEAGAKELNTLAQAQ